jgi:hypothetical protein
MMGAVAARVARGEKVQFRPTGSSMVPLIRSRQLVTVAPVDAAKLDVDGVGRKNVEGKLVHSEPGEND